MLGGDGNFYGITDAELFHFDSTVFRMTPDGVITTLAELGLGQVIPKGVAPGRDGNFYGTTVYGGTNKLGTIFRITPSGVVTILVEFTGNGRWGERPWHCKPQNLAAPEVPEATRAQWRLLGGPWLDSGVERTGLPAGTYLIECKVGQKDRITPPPASVTIEEGAHREVLVARSRQ